MDDLRRVCDLKEKPEEIYFKRLDRCLDALMNVYKNTGGATGTELRNIVKLLEEEV